MRCFLMFFIKAYVVGTHLNCIDKSMQFKWITTTYAFIKKYTGCYLKTTELLDCAVTGVSAIIKSNTVFNLRPYDIIKIIKYSKWQSP